MRFYRDSDDPFQFGGVFGDKINMKEVLDPNGLALRLLRFSAHNFLHWGVDDASDVFAAYSFTLESGFPEEAIKEVLRSIPLVDESVGEMVQFIE